ncbi:uncharacterized protein HMPREF1541_03778 [Cyphellophora europaea CBS 101466]|uniref:Zn(2)-C6 fungal-type domain-containing protein n=1 Tax=Cyphellophora europaea (strain CBS 101466) TaxID=1220924 RepID=W2RZB9_CYPE1|nr:uncharacterized protein HMPREF1541_03778 [Cyphellophora europaea CBS 101466]ETN41841.1 hypothetical protein HMPREF1541_03778 [Cyphellophora europaea CBS 101466]
MSKNQSTKSTPTTSTLQNSPKSMTEPEASAPVPAQKSKRVRTGCLTCRERHLKCDEGLPNCQNCKKSNRTCKRGIRLNFHDIQCEQPPFLLPRTHDWEIAFQDNSRDIASEYVGGLEKYHPLEPPAKRQKIAQDVSYAQVGAPILSHQQLPAQSYQSYSEAPQPGYSGSGGGYVDAMQQMQSYADQGRQSFSQPVMQQQTDYPPPLDDRTEVLYTQVFVEEVGLWMDSMDADKHFSRLIPFQALREPMLKYALLACGVRHLTLVNPSLYPDDHALNYYNNATQLLLKSLQNPDRDSVLCATTATILNVYEVMSEKALQRMNHIAGARALIKECRWDANATGIGGACFWLNVGLELFSCLHFNWGVAWDPDTWGIDMTMNPQPMGGNEEDWTHKILWILAKVTNFRSTAPRFQEQTVQAEQMRMNRRYQEWLGLKQFCDKWDRCVPPTMHAMANVPVYSTNSKSAFPGLWFIKRTTVVARLFYHTAMALLGAVHPLNNIDQSVLAETDEMRQYHSRQICGIVAHVKDRGVASASIRCLAVAGENLTVKREQEEVLDIFDKIKKETGWRVAFINDALKEKWGWNTTEFDTTGAPSFYQQGTATMPPVSTRPKYPSGIINPLYKNADFSAVNPPYQGSYVPPTTGHMLHTGMYGFSSIAAM